MNPVVDRDRFFALYRERYGRLTQAQVDGLAFLLDSLESDPDVQDLRWAAYMLATVKHECADTYRPILEIGPRHYFDKYEPGTRLGKALGNVTPGDGYRRRGRGFVMTTGLANDRRLTLKLGLTGADDLVLHPERALDPGIAYRIMSHGMRRGLFTGHDLDDYILGERCDYFNSRRIINRLDKAALIAGYAESFAAALGA